MNAAEQTATFCSVLLDDLAEVDGPLFCTVWSNGPTDTDKITRWVPVSDVPTIVDAVRESDATPGFNTYLSMGASRERFGPSRRMRRNNVDAITSVWVEIDIAGDAHAADNLPRTVAEARAVLDSMGLPPSMVWHSGHGLQACWLLDEPWVFGDSRADADADREEAQELLRDWRGSLAVHAHRLGRYKVDSVHNVDRVLRVPGTTNRKVVEIKNDEGEVIGTEPLPETECVLVEHDASRRYAVDDLRARLVDAKQLEAFRGIATDGIDNTSQVDLKAVWALVRSYAPDYQPQWLIASLEFATAAFRDVWENGHEGGDSDTDISLARHIANIGGTEADAVEAIMCYRLRTGRKTEKVDPHRRTDYLIRTVNNAFASKRKRDRELAEAAKGQTDALAAQDEELRRQRGPVADDEAIINPPSGAVPSLAEMAIHHIEHTTEVVVPDGTPSAPAAAPSAAIDGPAPELPADEEFDPESVEPVARPVADIPGAPEPRQRDVLALAAERDGNNPGGTGPGLLPPPNPWGTRTESQTSELDALSEMLLVDGVRVWRLLERGRGAKMERRLQLRAPTDHVWLTAPPTDYRPGEPFHTGWWPAASFNAVNGFIAALRQDAKLITRVVAAAEFNVRFGDTLVRLWEPDERSGSLANVAVAGISTYLTTHAVSADWAECAAGATPFIKWTTRPRWAIDGIYEVWVRWSELCRFIRSQQAQQVTPQVSAELLEISHSMVVNTDEQHGQWYKIDRGFLTDWMWEAILDAGRTAEARRTERHGMHVVNGQR